ncbi:LOW QUALITY PROTEIN: hypothetical protein V2J09_013501, partial [Rumex salicifolius]
TQSIELTQSRTGDTIDNKPQFLVEVFYQCGDCSQDDVKLFCDGFQTIGKFPDELKKNGNNCVLFAPINPVHEIQFTFTWDTPFKFSIISSKPTCVEAVSKLESLNLLRSLIPIYHYNVASKSHDLEVFDELHKWDRAFVRVRISGLAFHKWLNDIPSCGTLRQLFLFLPKL